MPEVPDESTWLKFRVNTGFADGEVIWSNYFMWRLDSAAHTLVRDAYGADGITVVSSAVRAGDVHALSFTRTDDVLEISITIQRDSTDGVVTITDSTKILLRNTGA